MELKVEVNESRVKPHPGFQVGNTVLMITPPVGEDFWWYRVRLSDGQAIQAFPKFGTVGIGFAVEEDWNTNFPHTCPAREIFEHIKHNKGDDAISDDDCVKAIAMLQDFIGRTASS